MTSIKCTKVITSNMDQAIYKSTITLIFLSHHYMKCEDCIVKTNIALGRLQSGHKLISIMIQSCKVPKSLRQVYCWYVWKDSPQQKNSKILTAITGQRTRRDETQLLRKNEFIIHCAKDECKFRVYCDNITEAQRHKERCKHRIEKCKFCRKEVPRKSLEKHEQRICKSRRVKCPNTNCGVSTTVRERKKHAYNCQHSMAYENRKYFVKDSRKEGYNRRGTAQYGLELDSDTADALSALFEIRIEEGMWARVLKGLPKVLKRKWFHSKDDCARHMSSEREETVAKKEESVTVKKECVNPTEFMENVASVCEDTTIPPIEPQSSTEDYVNFEQSNSNTMTWVRRRQWDILMDMIDSGICEDKAKLDEILNSLIPSRQQRNI